MNSDYICDDRGVWEETQKIRNMTDEEFENYIDELRKKEQEEQSDNK